MSEDGSDPTARPIDLARAPEFVLGGLEVRPAERLVEGGGLRRELQPRVMQVLVALAQARPRVVSRDQLIEQCWNGRVVGDDALNRCILALRQLAKAASPEPFVIETVPRVGHRLVEHREPSPQAAPAATPIVRPRRMVRAAIVGLLILLGLVAGWQWWLERSDAREPATIAVIPFRSLSSGDPFFAEGVGEEILNRLAEEPEFRVAGRTSAAQYRNASDLRDVGRALGVAYVLEGSVRAEPGRVRVNAALVQTSDGMRLWSQTYDRKLDDILEIQEAIGASVADALSRKLLVGAPRAGTVAVDGEAYRNYLSARGMLRTRNPQLGASAIALLRQAVAADPNYAPAWASLAQAIRLDAPLAGHEKVIETLPEAVADARKAIALAPDLAEAHGVLGSLLGFSSHEAQAHLRRAAELDPKDAESILYLASAERIAGNFEGEIAAYRRAVKLDPHWFRPTRDLAIALAEMGDRSAADALAQQAVRKGLNEGSLGARIAWTYGDFTKATQFWTSKAKVELIWQAPGRTMLSNARFTLGLPGAQPPMGYVPMAELRSNGGRFWMAAAPSIEVWRQRNRSGLAALVYDEENIVAAKLMLSAGRTRELLVGYDSPVGLLGLRKNQPVEVYQLHTAPLVALALRDAGRVAESNHLLSQAGRAIDAVHRRGKVPFTFDVDAAAIAAVAGQKDRAVHTLERAEKRGWRHTAPDDLVHLTDEPAFASLNGDTRFKALVSALNSHLAREREKALQLGL